MGRARRQLPQVLRCLPPPRVLDTQHLRPKPIDQPASRGKAARKKPCLSNWTRFSTTSPSGR
jgi:hypothetical protein